MACYRNGGCGPYEMMSCSECPASKPEYCAEAPSRSIKERATAEYIEREAVLKFIEDGLNNPDKLKAFGHDAIEIMTEVQYAPAADVAPVVHGKWNIEEVPNTVDTYGRPVKIARCSLCGFQWSDIHAVRKYFKGCPNCLAKMDTEETKHETV